LLGLIPGHAYSVLDVKDLTNAAGEIEHTIIKIRNPWSSDTWDGPWRDDDPNWTDDYLQQIGSERNEHTNARDGIFWMDYQWFLDNMYNSGVSMYDKYAGYDHETL